MRSSTLTVFSSACIVSRAALAFHKKENPFPVAPGADLKRYEGKWFEIARPPARFEREWAGDVTAQFTLRRNGCVRVVNTCREENGNWRNSKEIARCRDPNGPASKVKVRFFWPFYGDHWILELDSDYQWALVGTPDLRYLWILSRSLQLPGETYRQHLARAHGLGFETSRIVHTIQSAQTGRTARHSKCSNSFLCPRLSSAFGLRRS